MLNSKGYWPQPPVPGLLIQPSGYCTQQFFDGTKLSLYLCIRPWVISWCWEVLNVKCLAHLSHYLTGELIVQNQIFWSSQSVGPIVGESYHNFLVGFISDNDGHYNG